MVHQEPLGRQVWGHADPGKGAGKAGRKGVNGKDAGEDAPTRSLMSPCHCLGGKGTGGWRTRCSPASCPVGGRCYLLDCR